MPTPPHPNPLCRHDSLPAFTRIRAEHVQPALDVALGNAQQALEALLTDCADPNWAQLVIPLELLGESLEQLWSPVRHLHAVMDSPQLRAAYSECLLKLNSFQTALSQNECLYQAFVSFAASPAWPGLERPQQRLVNNTLKDFRLGGVGLDDKPKQRFMDISSRLAQCGTEFANHVLDATQAWTRHVTSIAELQGLPEVVIQQAQQYAQRAGLDGWLLTLDLPCFIPVMGFANDAALREDMYTAYITRASECGPDAGKFDNTALMHEILELRMERARLLGFAHHAQYSLARKMVGSAQEVLTFLGDLAERTKPFARRELAQLREFASSVGCTDLQPFQIAYYAEQLKQRDYAFNQEDVRPYFPAQCVLQGLFDLTQQLFDVRIEASSTVETWHPDVRYYELHDADENLLGGFYLDLYARAGKRGGAWMDVCRNRMDLGNGVQLAVAYLTCNFTLPGIDHDALLSHDEVTTLFHEFGHGLHHLLSRINLPGITGINGVEWDAVELPSQFMENWCYEPQVLGRISGHYKSAEPLPAELVEKIRAARTFHSGLQMLRQIEFALFDFRLHMEYRDGFDIQALAEQVHDEIAVVPIASHNRYANSFSHIFDGGYAAGYYSYKWAEVLSSDAFARFEEVGLDCIRQTGLDFRHEILERGGSRDALESFIAFRGRPPDSGALLRHSGLQPLTDHP